MDDRLRQEQHSPPVDPFGPMLRDQMDDDRDQHPKEAEEQKWVGKRHAFYSTTKLRNFIGAACELIMKSCDPDICNSWRRLQVGGVAESGVKDAALGGRVWAEGGVHQPVVAGMPIFSQTGAICGNQR